MKTICCLEFIVLVGQYSRESSNPQKVWGQVANVQVSGLDTPRGVHWIGLICSAWAIQS